MPDLAMSLALIAMAVFLLGVAFAGWCGYRYGRSKALSETLPVIEQWRSLCDRAGLIPPSDIDRELSDDPLTSNSWTGYPVDPSLKVAPGSTLRWDEARRTKP